MPHPTDPHPTEPRAKPTRRRYWALAALPALIAALWPACSSPAWAASPPYYIATDLGGFVSNGTPLNFAVDLTNSGAAVGYALVASEQFGLLWPADGPLRAITLSGQLLAANDGGTWVGAQDGRMTRWVDGVAEVLDNRANSVAQLVNNSGWVIGQVPGAGTVLWRAGLGETPVTGIGLARALNDNGVVAGSTSVGGGQHAAFWTLTDGLSVVPVAGGNSELRGLNSSGVFVGDVVRTGGTRSFIGSITGGVSDLVLPSGYSSSHVWAINDSGVAVGLVSSDPTNQTAGSTRVALWRNGGVEVLDVHGASVYNWAGFVDINNRGQILVGANVGTTALSPAHESFLLNPCTRCGQINPNPNPEGQVISLDSSWTTPFNGLAFDNRGAILVSSTLDNLQAGMLATTGSGFVDVSGELRNFGRLTFEDRGNGLPSLRVAGAGALLDLRAGSSLHTSGLVQVQEAAQVVADGSWTLASGAQLEIGGTAFPAKADVTVLGSLLNAHGAQVRVHTGDGSFALGLSASLLNHGVLQFSSDKVTLSGQLENFSDGLISIESAGNGALASAQSIAGKLFNSGRLHIGNTADLRLQIRQSSLVNFGQVDIDGGGQLFNSGLVYGEAGSAITVAKGGQIYNARELWLNQGAQLQVDDDGGIHPGFNNDAVGSVPAQFFNAGTVLLNTVANGPDGAIRNTGYLLVAGTLTNRGSFSNLGGGEAQIQQLKNNGLVSTWTQAWEISATQGPQLSHPGTQLPSLLRLSGPAANLPGGIVLLNSGTTTRFSDRFENSGLVEVFGDLQGDTPLADYVQLAGLTQVNGTLSAQHIDCQHGSFKGSGTLSAAGGISFGDCTVSPGNSPGELRLVGDVQFDGTTFAMEVGAAAADRLVIDGRVTLRNAHIALSFLDGAMPDPMAAINLFVTRSDCAGCDDVAGLSVTVLGAPAGWQGTLGSAAIGGGAIALTTLSLTNPDAQVINDDLQVSSTHTIDPGAVVMQSNATHVAAAALFDNQGAFYNLGDGHGGGPAFVNEGQLLNRAGAGLLNRGLITNRATLTNAAGAAFNNRGEVRNVDGSGPAVLRNQGRFNNGPEGVLRNGDPATGQGGLIVNEAGGVFANHGLIVNRGAAGAPPSAQPQIINRGQFDNHGQIDSNAEIVNDGGLFTIHATGQVTGDGVYRQLAAAAGAVAPARTVVNGLLAAQVQLDTGSWLSGNGTVAGAVHGGIIAPGDGLGTLTIDGSVTAAAFDIEVAGTGEVDHLLVSGLAELGATRVLLAADYLPRDGEHLGWLQARSLRGLGGAALASTLADAHWLSFAVLGADGSTAALDDIAPPLLQDGRVFHALSVHGSTVYAAAEDSSDGFGLTFYAALPAPVPEPGSAALWLAGLLAMAWQRWRRP
jgi:hypothetical protein